MLMFVKFVKLYNEVSNGFSIFNGSLIFLPLLNSLPNVNVCKFVKLSNILPNG